MTVVSVLVALLLLGILITVHEFGHYIFARMTGIEVMEFAIGFGPKIVGWTGKSGTKFALRCIPLGGYCACAARRVAGTEGRFSGEHQRV